MLEVVRIIVLFLVLVVTPSACIVLFSGGQALPRSQVKREICLGLLAFGFVLTILGYLWFLGLEQQEANNA